MKNIAFFNKVMVFSIILFEWILYLVVMLCIVV